MRRGLVSAFDVGPAQVVKEDRVEHHVLRVHEHDMAVPAHVAGVFRFDDDVTAEVAHGHGLGVAENVAVLVGEGPIERDRLAVGRQGPDGPLLVLVLGHGHGPSGPWIDADVAAVLLAIEAREKQRIAGLPASRSLAKLTRVSPLRGTAVGTRWLVYSAPKMRTRPCDSRPPPRS